MLNCFDKSYITPAKEIKEVYKISTYVFTGKNGNVNISLC